MTRESVRGALPSSGRRAALSWKTGDSGGRYGATGVFMSVWISAAVSALA